MRVKRMAPDRKYKTQVHTHLEYSIDDIHLDELWFITKIQYKFNLFQGQTARVENS